MYAEEEVVTDTQNERDELQVTEAQEKVSERGNLTTTETQQGRVSGRDELKGIETQENK